MDAELGQIIVRAVVGVVITGLGFAVRGLFVRMRTAEAGLAALGKPDKAGQVAREELQKFKLCVAETYVRRDDYVMQMGGVIQKLDSIGTMVSRLDEWRRIQERMRDDS